ncbi:MAG: hypothetical protein ACXWFZ_06140 [Nitrososphaeraceae archaeon]
MFKGITITSTIFGMFLLTLMATGIQIPTFSVFAQESEIESVNASNSGSGNATSAQETEIETVNATSSPTSNVTSSESANATSVAKTAQAKPDAATISAGEFFAQQGTVTSTQDPLPGHEAHQLALILPPRDDGAIYQGTLTYTASKPVEVVILQNFANETAVDPTYGAIATAPLGEGTVAISLLTPQYTGPINAASIPFAGNALALHTLNGEPFAATYTVTGDVAQAQTFNAVSPPPLAEATQADTGDGDGKDGDGKDGDGKDGDGKDGDGDDGKDGQGGGKDNNNDD